jgi:hypothetical protein
VKILKFFDVDDPGWKKSRIRDREKHPGSATLQTMEGKYFEMGQESDTWDEGRV